MATTWKDFDNFFTKANNGDVTVMTDYSAIENSLINIFETMQGSRRMLPEFAGPIYRLLFEPIDRTTAGSIGELLLGSIKKWEPRIEVTGIVVDARPDQNQYLVKLQYIIIGTSNEARFREFNTILRSI